MNIIQLVERLSGRQVVEGANESAEVSGGYSSDLLSDVMANAQEGDVWITLQKHVNTVAVAQLKNLAGIVLVNGRYPDEDTLSKARAEKVPIVVTPMEAFDAAGVLHACGIRGRGKC